MLVLYEVLWRLTCEDQDVSQLSVSEEYLNELLDRRGGKRLLIDLLIRIIFSKFILSLNFNPEGF